MAVGTQFHVLAVDDSLIERKLIERLLKSSSFGVNSLIAVTAVDSATKALEFLGLQEQETDSDSDSDHHLPESVDEIQPVNLIITDYSMPGMTGYDLLRKIKGSKYLKDIPVFVMSSENIPSRINRCLEQGAEDFLLKPLRLTDMDKLKPHILRSSCRRRLPPYPEIPLS